MAAALRMPKLGLTMTEGMLATWAVKAGDRVKAGDVLFTVETDKIATDVEAAGDGEILALDAIEGDTYPVGAALGRWTGPASVGDDIAEPAAELAVVRTVETPPPQPSSAGQGARIVATPLARRLAQRESIDLARITGSGGNGRIKARDVIAAQSAVRPVAIATAAPALAPAQAAPIGDDRATRTPASSMRKVIARRMTEAKQTIPHFYVLAHAEIGKLERLRVELNAQGGDRPRISVTHLLAAAVARAILAIPEANEVWDDGVVVRHADVDIGIAIDSPRGLVAPLLRDAGSLGLRALVDRANALVQTARDGALTAADMRGGAITISNVGMFGAAALVPIVNPGQSSILGVGRTQRLFRPDEHDQPRLCEELDLVLACDHRIWDGARAAIFLDHVRTLIETPLNLLA